MVSLSSSSSLFNLTIADLFSGTRRRLLLQEDSEETEDAGNEGDVVEVDSSSIQLPQGWKRQRIMVPASSVPTSISAPSTGPASRTRSQLVRSTSLSVMPPATASGEEEEMIEQSEGAESILPEHDEAGLDEVVQTALNSALAAHRSSTG